MGKQLENKKSTHLDQDGKRAHVPHLRVLREGAARVEAVQRRLTQRHRQVVDVQLGFEFLEFVQPVAGELERAHEEPSFPRESAVREVGEEVARLAGEGGMGRSEEERRGGEERGAAGGRRVGATRDPRRGCLLDG